MSSGVGSGAGATDLPRRFMKSKGTLPPGHEQIAPYRTSAASLLRCGFAGHPLTRRQVPGRERAALAASLQAPRRSRSRATCSSSSAARARAPPRRPAVAPWPRTPRSSSPARAAARRPCAWARSRSRRARSSSTLADPRCRAPNDRLGLPEQDRQTTLADGAVERLAGEVAGERPGAGEPLDRGPQRLERRPELGRRSRRRPAARSPVRASPPHGRCECPRTSSMIASTAALGDGDRSSPDRRASGRRSAAAGSLVRCGRSPQIASVTNGMIGWSRRRYVSSASTSVHHVASRSASASSGRQGGPWPARGPSRSTRSRRPRTGSG